MSNRTFTSARAYRDAVNRGDEPAPQMTRRQAVHTAALRRREMSADLRRKWQSPAGLRRANNGNWA